jgi:hypothetical protein
MTDYAYSLADDFPNHKISPDKLATEIRASGSITTEFSGASTVGDACTLSFAADLSSNEKASLDAIVAAHDGVDITVAYKIAASLIGQSIDIVESEAWQELGGVSVNVEFYCPELDKAFAIVEYSAKAVGSSAQLRVIEVDDEGAEVVMSANAPIVASTGWKVSKFQTDHSPAHGDRTYILQGRLNGATSASIRYTALVLIEVAVA